MRFRTGAVITSLTATSKKRKAAYAACPLLRPRADGTRRSIYQLEKTINHTGGAVDTESRPLLTHEDPDNVFSRSLDVELEKISSFYDVKGRELNDEVAALLKDLGDRGEEGGQDGPSSQPLPRAPTSPVVGRSRPRRSSVPESSRSTEDGIEDSDDEGDETTALTGRRRNSWTRRKTMPNIMAASTDMTASTELTRSRRLSTTFADYDQHALFSSDIMLKRRIINLYVQLCELKSYVQLNKTGFRKVLKKYDKICNRSLRTQYMTQFVEPASPFRAGALKRLEANIAEMERAYTEVVTGGDEEAAKRDLRSHLREHVVWERNTVWRDMIGIERRAEAANLGRTLLGRDTNLVAARLQGDDEPLPLTKEIVTPIGRFRCPVWLLSGTMLTLLVIIGVFFALLYLPMLAKAEQQNCLAMLIFVSLLWSTEVRRDGTISGAERRTVLTLLGHSSVRDVLDRALLGRHPPRQPCGRPSGQEVRIQGSRCGRLLVHVESRHHAASGRLHPRRGAVQVQDR